MSELPVLDACAAFVDVGSEQMFVSIAGGAPEVFGTVTSQLHALRDWLLKQQVRSVAMEATGVYWLPLYAVLEAAGMEVLMVNGRQTRNLRMGLLTLNYGHNNEIYGSMVVYLRMKNLVPPASEPRPQQQKK